MSTEQNQPQQEENTNSQQLQGAELKDALKKELSRLFTKENLSSDPYLASHMGTNLLIPVAAVLGAPSIRALTNNRESLLEAARDVSSLSLCQDDMMIRPNIKLERTTIIIRDLPADMTEDEVRGIFDSSAHKDKIKNIHADVNNTWFVTFTSEDVTVDVALWLRSQKYKDQPIRATVKQETLLRSFYPIQTPTMEQQAYNPYAAGYYGAGYPTYGYDPRAAKGYGRGGDRRAARGGAQRGGRPRSKSIEKATPQIGSPPTSVLRMNPENFPPLPSAGKEENEGGYNGAFRHYPREQFMQICNSMAQIDMPVEYAEAKSRGYDFSSILLDAPRRDWAPLVPASPAVSYKKAALQQPTPQAAAQQQNAAAAAAAAAKKKKPKKPLPPSAPVATAHGQVSPSGKKEAPTPAEQKVETKDSPVEAQKTGFSYADALRKAAAANAAK